MSTGPGIGLVMGVQGAFPQHQSRWTIGTSCRSRVCNGSVGGSGRPRKILPGPWKSQAQQGGGCVLSLGTSLSPPSAEQPLCQSSPWVWALPRAQGKFVTVRAQAFRGQQGTLRHQGLHVCHDTVTEQAVQLHPQHWHHRITAGTNTSKPCLSSCLSVCLSSSLLIARSQQSNLSISPFTELLQPSCSPSLLPAASSV